MKDHFRFYVIQLYHMYNKRNMYKHLDCTHLWIVKALLDDFILNQVKLAACGL